MSTRKRTTPAPKSATPAADKEAGNWEDPALLPVHITDDFLESDLLGDCPPWCCEDHECANTRRTPTHQSERLLARASEQRGYDRASGQSYGHLTMRLHQSGSQVAPHLSLWQVWGDDDGTRKSGNQWTMTIPETRNLIVALQHLVKLSLEVNE